MGVGESTLYGALLSSYTLKSIKEVMREQALQSIGFLEKLIYFTLKPLGSLSQRDARSLPPSTDTPPTKQ
jgi:hypothetical protein